MFAASPAHDRTKKAFGRKALNTIRCPLSLSRGRQVFGAPIVPVHIPDTSILALKHTHTITPAHHTNTHTSHRHARVITPPHTHTHAHTHTMHHAHADVRTNMCVCVCVCVCVCACVCTHTHTHAHAHAHKHACHDAQPRTMRARTSGTPPVRFVRPPSYTSWEPSWRPRS